MVCGFFFVFIHMFCKLSLNSKCFWAQRADVLLAVTLMFFVFIQRYIPITFGTLFPGTGLSFASRFMFYESLSA